MPAGFSSRLSRDGPSLPLPVRHMGRKSLDIWGPPFATLDGHGHSRHFDLLLITKNTCLMAGKQAPRGDRRNPMHCTHDITVVAQRLFRLQRVRLTAITKDPARWGVAARRGFLLGGLCRRAKVRAAGACPEALI